MPTNNSQALSVHEIKALLQRKYPGIRYFPSQRPGWGYIDVPCDDDDNGGFDVEASGLMSDVCDSEEAAWKSAFEKDQAIQAYARTRHGPSPEPSDAEIREQATWLSAEQKCKRCDKTRESHHKFNSATMNPSDGEWCYRDGYHQFAPASPQPSAESAQDEFESWWVDNVNTLRIEAEEASEDGGYFCAKAAWQASRNGGKWSI
jgi:hypothetical protein